MFLGIIWRDMLFASVWLCAAALAFAAAEARSASRIAAQAVALALVALGVMLRPNALIAAPLLATYALWPSRFAWKRVALAYVPAGLILFGVMHAVYYDVLGAVRQHPLHSLFVFDLGGITHFSKTNQFPATWSPAEQRRLVTDCYDPYLWDTYWTGLPCSFVMNRLENEQHIFGTPVLSAAWRKALLSHPGAYLRHRAAFMGTFLFRRNFTIWTQDIGDMSKLALPNNRGFVALVAVSDVLKPTPLFRVVLWLLLCGAICVFAWRRRETPAGNFCARGRWLRGRLRADLCARRRRRRFPLRLLGRARGAHRGSGGHCGLVRSARATRHSGSRAELGCPESMIPVSGTWISGFAG